MENKQKTRDSKKMYVYTDIRYANLPILPYI